MKPMPRLSEDLTFPRAPNICQSCGATVDLIRWLEYDDLDRPQDVYVVLCHPCADRLIERHPRLYGAVCANEPIPGLMAICTDCKHLSVMRCTHPDAKANGGPGVSLIIQKPIKIHVCRTPRRLSGWETLWQTDAKGCEQKEALS